MTFCLVIVISKLAFKKKTSFFALNSKSMNEQLLKYSSFNKRFNCEQKREFWYFIEA